MIVAKNRKFLKKGVNKFEKIYFMIVAKNEKWKILGTPLFPFYGLCKGVNKWPFYFLQDNNGISVDSSKMLFVFLYKYIDFCIYF